jgi:hypothetical protein
MTIVALAVQKVAIAPMTRTLVARLQPPPEVWLSRVVISRATTQVVETQVRTEEQQEETLPPRRLLPTQQAMETSTR